MHRGNTLKMLEKLYQVKDFFCYIVESFLNGEKKKALHLFKEMTQSDKRDFMIELNNCKFTQYGDGPWQIELLDHIIRNITIK